MKKTDRLSCLRAGLATALLGASPALLAAAAPPAPTVPAAPSGTVATLGNRSAAVAFTPGADGGAPIDRYRAVCTSSNGGASATSFGSGPPVTNAPLTPGKLYACVVAAHNSVGWGADSAASALFLVPATVTGLPDTGQDQCWDGVALVACTPGNTGDAAAFPRQDGRYGRDAAAASGALAKTGGGAKGFDYTALDAGGNPVAPSAGANPHACVRDNASGLVWEVKTDDGGLHDKDWNYTWYDSNPGTNGGVAGTSSGGSCGGTVAGGCDTEKFVAAVNAAGRCGFSDWRLPSFRELFGLGHLGALNPAIDGSYFPNTRTSNFWSGSSYASFPGNAWVVHFSNGNANAFDKMASFDVRLVRGGQ